MYFIPLLFFHGGALLGKSFFRFLVNFSSDFSIVFIYQAFQNTGEADGRTIKNVSDMCAVNFTISGQPDLTP